MKHKHAEIIKRWIANTELVILVKDNVGWIHSMYQQYPRWHKNMEYFLVPEKHAEVALHWLNGGEVELLNSASGIWRRLNLDNPSFNIESTYRIKPKSEIVKAWVGTPKQLSPDASYVVYKQKPTAPWVEEYTWTEVEVEEEV